MRGRRVACAHPALVKIVWAFLANDWERQKKDKKQRAATAPLHIPSNLLHWENWPIKVSVSVEFISNFTDCSSLLFSLCWSAFHHGAANMQMCHKLNNNKSKKKAKEKKRKENERPAADTRPCSNSVVPPGRAWEISGRREEQKARASDVC